jgi:hypothetical protein
VVLVLLVLVLILLLVMVLILLVVLVLILLVVLLMGLIMVLILVVLLMVLLVVVLFVLLWTQCPTFGKSRNRAIFQRRKGIYFVQQIEVWFVLLKHRKFLVCLWQPTHVLLKMRFSAEKEL